MIISQLTPSGDWSYGGGLSNYLTLNEAIGQNIATRILSWVGDCFFDQTAGIDWLNRLGNESQQELLDLDFRRIILQSYGVTGINSASTQLIGRNFTGTYNINTIFTRNYINTITQEIGYGNS